MIQEECVNPIAVVLAVSALVLGLPAGKAQAAVPGRPSPAPFVSTTWLAAHAGTPGLVVVDLRSAADYDAGHLPNSVSIPFAVPLSAWIVSRDDLLLELPPFADLSAALGRAGITKRSKVVLVTGVSTPPQAQAGGTRAAVTLMYAGLTDVSILDGGHPKWVADGRATTTAVPAVTPVTFDGTAGGVSFVDIDYVRAAVGRTTIVDARDADVYSGKVVEPYANKAGHIPSAVSLPTVSFFNADGGYRTTRELRVAVEGVVGTDKNKEVIVYCGVGGYASTTTFVMTKLLGYRNVKFYDGSAQEWVRNFSMEL
ncbi:MAG: thiosulfate/3-mercaptopyruvate sulfurtransferase [Actinomycetota bacterium]|nr:thiosulfate/3-mercaptopyruvate sulfurtransferase [Actinomycetota bacterium]